MSSDEELFGVDAKKQREAEELYNREIEIMDQQILKTFSTPHGRKVLEYMTKTSQQVGADPNLGYDKGAAWGFYREGQAGMVWDIKERMKRAENNIKSGAQR